MEISLDNLKYAKYPTLSIIDGVYARYEGDSFSLEGITHLADIHADTKALSEIQNSNTSMGILTKAIFADSTLFGAIDRDDVNNIGFIAFRGTETPQEWIDDFWFPQVQFQEINSDTKPFVHQGFYGVYLLARQSMMDQIKQLARVSKIIVTGHSLGAAVASLCALDLACEATYPEVESSTFASPRVFGVSTRLFESKVPTNLRVANPVDIVTQVPLLTQLYFHVQGGLHIAPKIEDFHSLDGTYAPGLQQVIDQSGGQSVKLEPAEDVVLRERK